MRPAIEANADHLSYHYCFDVADQDVIRVFQLYTDQTAATNFLQSAAYAAYLNEVEALLVGPPDIATAHQEWAKNDNLSTTQVIPRPADGPEF
jgi:quinol monooxygenase YgiN